MISENESFSSELHAVSVMNFGATGKGNESDSHAIQYALDSGKNVYFPPGNYLLESPVTVTRSRQLIFGDGGMREGSNGTSQLVARLFTKMEKGTLINVQSHMVTIRGLAFEGPGRKSEANSERNITAIKFEKEANKDDVDGRVLECVLDKFVTGIRVVGRGLRTERCVFASINEGIQLAWPKDPIAPDPNDPFELQPLPYGMRSFVITNNRIHACSTFLVNEGSRGQNRLWGMVLTNNLIDVGDALFRGGATYSVISNNVIAHCNKTVLTFNGSCHHTVISSNIISGHDQISGKQPAHGIRFTNNCHDLSITSNTFANTRKDALRFEADRQNYVTIQGNNFSNIGTTDLDAKVILFTKPAGDFSITGNTFKPGGSDRRIIWANGNHVTGFEVHGNAYQRNSTLIGGIIDNDDSFNTFQI